MRTPPDPPAPKRLPNRIRDMQELGIRIREARAALRLSQRDAAGLCGVSVALWSDVERGQRENVSFGTVLRILQTLGLDLGLEHRGRAKPEAP